MSDDAQIIVMPELICQRCRSPRVRTYGIAHKGQNLIVRYHECTACGHRMRIAWRTDWSDVQVT